MSLEEKVDEARKEEKVLVRAFREVFGADEASRTAKQKIVWAVFQNRVEAPVFQSIRGGQLDALHAATNEGQRIFAKIVMDLATATVEPTEKPTVKK